VGVHLPSFNRVFSDLHAIKVEVSAIKMELGRCGCYAEEYINELKPHIHDIEYKLDKFESLKLSSSGKTKPEEA